MKFTNSNSNQALILIHKFTAQVNKGFLNKAIFHKIINSNLKLDLKNIVSLILIDTKMGDWNTAQQDSNYLISDIQDRLLNGYRIVGKRP